MTVPTRRRRSPEAARAAILAAAETLLAEGGVEAVQVRAVARRAGMTDAGVTHHFKDRQGLLTALIEDAGRRGRAALDAVVDAALSGDLDVTGLLRVLARPYGQGYAELAVALHAAGWRDRGEPVFGRVVEVLHAARLAWGQADPDIVHTRLTLAAFHQAVALDPLYGEAFRRSAGVKAQAAKSADAQLEWWIATVQTILGLSTR
jgi:AcrR family transcriptional regulator